MEHWHLEGSGGNILCGAKFGIISPDPHPYCLRIGGGPLCPSCLEVVGDEIRDLRERARDRELAEADRRGDLEEGELCLECDGQGTDPAWRGPGFVSCRYCCGEGRVGL